MSSVLLCGGGSTAQALACLLGSRYTVTVLCLQEEEANRWNEGTREAGCMTMDLRNGKFVRAIPDMITQEPSAASACDIIVCALPAALQEEYLRAVEPHVKEGAVVTLMPARSGGDFLFRSVMGAKASRLSLAAFETLPWACRVAETGKTVTMLGVTPTIRTAIVPAAGEDRESVAMRLQAFLGLQPIIQICPNVLTLSLENPGQLMHPGIFYGQWRNWDGGPVQVAPLYYHGVDEETARLLADMSVEVQAISKRCRRLGCDTRHVRPIFEWYMETHSGRVADGSSLQSALNTDSAYAGMHHPMTKCGEESLVPNFSFRYLSEDVPLGLCFSRGVAELLGVRTPTIDRVLLWAQEKLGKLYLAPSGRMEGKDVPETRAPQAFGVTSRALLLRHLGTYGCSSVVGSCFMGICCL